MCAWTVVTAGWSSLSVPSLCTDSSTRIIKEITCNETQWQGGSQTAVCRNVGMWLQGINGALSLVTVKELHFSTHKLQYTAQPILGSLYTWSGTEALEHLWCFSWTHMCSHQCTNSDMTMPTQTAQVQVLHSYSSVVLLIHTTQIKNVTIWHLML